MLSIYHAFIYLPKDVLAYTAFWYLRALTDIWAPVPFGWLIQLI